ncbi:MAG: ATP-binding protein [Sulfurimonas sp.]|nr:ATP-binding protein [Sulfurimonas sp.]
MELVYLWVEEYKNIRNQGFNFSPRFTCKYEDGELKIIDKEKTKEPYLKNFFGKNVNVTAIVGENGSGKSSLFEKLYSSFGTRLYIILSNNQFEIYTSLTNIKIQNNTAKLHSINKGRLPQVHFSWDILHYEPVLDWYSYGKTNPNILLGMLGTFSHPEYMDLKSYKNNYVIKYIEIFTQNKINIFSFSPTKINIKLFMKKNENEWDFEKIKAEIEKLNFPKEEAEVKKEVYFRTISKYIEKYLQDGSNEKNFTLEEYNLLLHELEDMKKVLSRFPAFMLDMYDNDISFFSLSHGERSILLSNALLYESAINTKNQGILICLDEPDLSLHPEWQKKYINELVKMFSKITKNFHFLITSHSPFILSDIPKKNVIFLEKGKQVYPNIETFGANIHTLLSHGFFMKDGLMGEFAKEKIDKAITHLNQKTLTEKEIDYCENIISIVGEPILKNQLQKMLDSKRLSEVEQIKQEIKRLEERMTLIWKNSK